MITEQTGQGCMGQLLCVVPSGQMGQSTYSNVTGACGVQRLFYLYWKQHLIASSGNDMSWVHKCFAVNAEPASLSPGLPRQDRFTDTRPSSLCCQWWGHVRGGQQRELCCRGPEKYALGVLVLNNKPVLTIESGNKHTKKILGAHRIAGKTKKSDLDV